MTDTNESPATPSKAAHTPGPWLISRDIFGEINIETPKRGGCTFVIASDVGGEIRKDAKGHWSDMSEVEANALLIAAAPQQHDALLAVLYAPGFGALDEATKNAVRAAIAKATKATKATGEQA